MELPTIFLPLGGGPCVFMNHGDRPDPVWWPMEDYLRGLVADLPERPRAILLISGHWEERHLTDHVGERPSLYFDYYNYQPPTYELRWDEPGVPEAATPAGGMTRKGGFATEGEEH